MRERKYYEFVPYEKCIKNNYIPMYNNIFFNAYKNVKT